MRVASGIYVVASTVILQAAPNFCAPEKPYRVGYTTTKKLGSAVVRNRTRRRLRAAVSEIFPLKARSNVDYVLIGRKSTISCAFADLKKDVNWALKRLNNMIENGIYHSIHDSVKPKDTNV